MNRKFNKWVKAWLIAGVVLIFFQIVIGGITRLTGSGLSITKWEIVTGTLPPLSKQAWEEAFDLYKATPQYLKLNSGMSLSDFKYIYFWEYFHRLWARLMLFIFLIGFTIFTIKGWFSKRLKKRLLVLVLLAALVGFFGWLMVASGLKERPWVNAYNLSVHLTIALVVYTHLLWTTFLVREPHAFTEEVGKFSVLTYVFTGLIWIQIFLGGMMSGMKAALFYPSWPHYDSKWIPEVLTASNNWVIENFVNYDSEAGKGFMVAFTQFAHRNMAYIIFIFGIYILYTTYSKLKISKLKYISTLLVSLLVIQVILGVSTLLYSKGAIPIALGIFHQIFAIIVLGVSLYLNFVVTKRKPILD